MIVRKDKFPAAHFHIGSGQLWLDVVPERGSPAHASRYAQEVRCTAKCSIFPSSASWQGDPLARPRCIPPAIGAAQALSLPAPADRCAGRSPVRVLAPDTRQSEECSRSSDASMTKGESYLPLDTRRTPCVGLDCDRLLTQCCNPLYTRLHRSGVEWCKSIREIIYATNQP